MKKLLIISFFAFSFVLHYSVAAEATLISVDDIVFGTKSILRDTDSGLDWLRITEETTLGKKFTEIEFLLSSTQYTDFRFASKSELEQLISNSGYDGSDTASISDYLALNGIIFNIGPTYSYSSGEFPSTIYNWAFLNGMLEPTILKFEDYGGILGATAYLHSIPIGKLTSINSFLALGGSSYFSDYEYSSTSFMEFPGLDDETNDPKRGAFLVRTTGDIVSAPEPATMLLLGLGLIGLVGVRRKM